MPSSVGINRVSLTVVNAGTLYFSRSFGTTDISIDNVSVREVLPNEDYGITLTDKLKEAYVSPSAKIKDVNCLESSGAQTITNANIANGAVVTNAGTADGTATAGVITFTAGTISQVALDGVMTYVCAEGSNLPFDVSENDDDITEMTCTWTTSDTLANGSWNTAIGFTFLEYITLLLTTIPPMSLVPDLNQVPA
jgi:hypothetical protein